jgi:hypothetical protein
MGMAEGTLYFSDSAGPCSVWVERCWTWSLELNKCKNETNKTKPENMKSIDNTLSFYVCVCVCVCVYVCVYVCVWVSVCVGGMCVYA